jgi:hypothetical protein
MSNGNDEGMVMAMSMMMAISMSGVMSSIALAIGVFMYREHSVVDKTVKGSDWTDVTMDVPDEVRSDTDDNCVYFYNHGKKWTDGDGKDGTVTSSGQWCIADGVDTDVPIWETKNQRGSLSHDSVDYIRLGKNLNVQVFNNHTKSNDSFSATGDRKMYYGKDWGHDKLIHTKDGVGQDDIDAFRISKAT